MTDPDYTVVQLAVRHRPDENSGPFANPQEAQAAGHDTLTPITGMYEFGAVIDGAFVTILSEKASLVFDAIELGKPAEAPPADTPADATTPPPADTPAA